MSAYGWERVGKKREGSVFPYRRTRDGKMFGLKRWACYYKGRGQVYRKSLKMDFATEDDASVWRKEAEAKTHVVSDKPPVFSGAVTKYRSKQLMKGRAETSYQYLGLWQEAFGSRSIDSINSDLVETHLDKWQIERGWTNATRNRALNQLSGFFSFAYGRRWIDQHPTEHGRVEQQEEAGGRKRWLNMTEVENIIRYSPVWLQQIVRFGVATGMRLGEICSLTRADFQNVVREGSDQSIPACIVTNTKNGKTLAYPLHGWPLEYIRSRVEQLDFPAGRLFPGPHGGNARMSIPLRANIRETVSALSLE